MADSSANLKVLVVGAGIGGLSAAIALRQQGHHVEVFEKSRLASEVGAAVHCAPNCTALLNRMGIYPDTFGATVNESINFRDKDAVSRFSKAYADERRHWQAEYYLVHRVDLHTALKDKALSQDGPGTPATLHTACAVTDVDCDSATITFADGTTATGDVVVAADGIHSRARSAVVGREVPLFTSGKCGYRWLTPTQALLEDEETQIFAQEPGQVVQVGGEGSNGDFRRIVFYPCSNGKIMNAIAFVPTPEVGPIQKGLSGYNQSANRGKLIQHFDGFSSPVMHMLEKAPAEDVMLWDLLDMEVLPTFIRGRAVLLGDAAHPFLPYMGQGAAQAVEDAAALGACLPAGTPAEEVPQRLRVWEQCRKERADWVQEVTRVRGRDPNGKQGPPQTPEAFADALERCVSHNAWDHAMSVMNSLAEGRNDERIAASL
ncbi:salicylate hydroxylase [Diplodia corticola]|uniref:Salicylate hydroxylase n=1 Tax=Diplodia corticola TaxID=236234 RepID=A0A1J9RLI6_9PEZI|nr:salicylate hydroxylase [Diplodia corticola]OJD29375.1 salicylate hydroxylase [Diplodia corticola]